MMNASVQDALLHFVRDQVVTVVSDRQDDRSLVSREAQLARQRLTSPFVDKKVWCAHCSIRPESQRCCL